MTGASLLRRLKYAVQDPPPLLVFEVSEQTVSAVRRNPKTYEVDARARRDLPPGVVDPAPGRPNVQQPQVLEEAVRETLEELGPVRRPDITVILPDACSRLTVLDFDQLPSDANERLGLIRWRLKKTVPFNIDEARISYRTWSAGKGTTALVAATPPEVVRQYETPFEHAGLWPGYVSLSSLSALNLLPDGEMVLFAKLAGSSMTMAAVEKGVVRMIRWVELTPGAGSAGMDVWNDVAGDLYPTLVFVNDNFETPVSKVALCGFGESESGAYERLAAELGCPVEALHSPGGPLHVSDAGIWGYLSRN